MIRPVYFHRYISKLCFKQISLEIRFNLPLVCLYNDYALKQEIVSKPQMWAVRVLENQMKCKLHPEQRGQYHPLSQHSVCTMGESPEKIVQRFPLFLTYFVSDFRHTPLPQSSVKDALVTVSAFLTGDRSLLSCACGKGQVPNIPLPSSAWAKIVFNSYH